MTERARMDELITKLNAASRAYYHENQEIMPDREYDALYDELVQLEAKTGIKLATSPTDKVGYEVVSALEKAPHDIPMLSLDKTKDITALSDFLADKHGLLLWKLDGLAIVLRYEDGGLKQALTRGNGQIGEVVTHNARVFTNLPLAVPYKGKFSVRGEALIRLADFDAINDEEEGKYKNPRNLCSGTVRQLNSEIAAKRRVFFYALGLNIAGDSSYNAPPPADKKSAQLAWLTGQGFDVVNHEMVMAETVAETVEKFKSQIPSLPVATDGLVLTYDDIPYSESLGATSKFPRDSLAFKWADEIAETNLKYIEWNPSRTGLINPVAVFEPVEIEGSVVSRASLHNVSILKGLELGDGDKITVYKANMIIPQVAENLTRSKSAKIPDNCPVCGEKTEISVQRKAKSSTENDGEATQPPDQQEGEVLICPNPLCGAKLMQSLVHFVNRDGLSIEGLSEQTLEKLVAKGIISNYTDLFTLGLHQEAILSLEGFGKRSYEKLLTAIEKAKDIALPNFIYALGIRHVGLANAKLLCAHFDYDFAKIITACQSQDYLETLAEVKGFGDAISHSLHEYFNDETNVSIVNSTLANLRIKAAPKVQSNQPLAGLTFVITGDVSLYPNRKALQSHIESLGGRVTGSVTAKTSYLINNNAKSNSTKNKKAAELGVKIITEDDYTVIAGSGPQ